MSDREPRLIPLLAIGTVIREIRLAQGMTSRQLDKATDVAASYINQLETGRRGVSGKHHRELTYSCLFEALGYDLYFAIVKREEDSP